MSAALTPDTTSRLRYQRLADELLDEITAGRLVCAAQLAELEIAGLENGHRDVLLRLATDALKLRGILLPELPPYKVCSTPGCWRRAVGRGLCRSEYNAAWKRGLFPPMKPAACGTDAGYRAHLDRGEPTCDRCRKAHAEANRRREGFSPDTLSTR